MKAWHNVPFHYKIYNCSEQTRKCKGIWTNINGRPLDESGQKSLSIIHLENKKLFIIFTRILAERAFEESVKEMRFSISSF